MEDLVAKRPQYRACECMTHVGLQEALDEVLGCPLCHGQLLLRDAAEGIYCIGCRSLYPVCEGIPVFLLGSSVFQESERRFRDALAAEHVKSDRHTLLRIVARHHCVPMMRKRAEDFRARFKPHGWLLDLGIGYGWHWAGKGRGAKILGIDMSLGNLRLAQHLLDQTHGRVVLICADVAALPIRKNTISGVWSVQVFQHFPEAVLQGVLLELSRVVRDEFVMEIYNLNPAWLYRVLYRLVGKQLHRRGKLGEMELNRLSAGEWTEVWRKFEDSHVRISHGYSELFFHPNFRLQPKRYPMKLEHTLATHAPRLAALFARQVHICIEAGNRRDSSQPPLHPAPLYHKLNSSVLPSFRSFSSCPVGQICFLPIRRQWQPFLLERRMLRSRRVESYESPGSSTP